MFKISTFQNFLQQEFPECTIKNENRELIFFATMIILAIVKKPIEDSS
jgi:hypothetical protein